MEKDICLPQRDATMWKKSTEEETDWRSYLRLTKGLTVSPNYRMYFKQILHHRQVILHTFSWDSKETTNKTKKGRGKKKKKKKEHSNTQSSPRPVNECSTKSQRPERNHQRLVTQITTHPEPRAKRRLPRPPHPLPYLLPGEEGSRVVEAWDVSFSKK